MKDRHHPEVYKSKLSGFNCEEMGMYNKSISEHERLMCQLKPFESNYTEIEKGIFYNESTKQWLIYQNLPK